MISRLFHHIPRSPKRTRSTRREFPSSRGCGHRGGSSAYRAATRGSTRSANRSWIWRIRPTLSVLIDSTSFDTPISAGAATASSTCSTDPTIGVDGSADPGSTRSSSQRATTRMSAALRPCSAHSSRSAAIPACNCRYGAADRMPAVTQPTQPCAAPQRHPAAAADQDRHAPRLQRPGREPDPRKVEETAGERRTVRRPQLPQHLNRLVGIRTPGRVVAAQRPVLLLQRPHPHAERHPPAGEHVERRHRLGQYQRIHIGQQRHRRPQPHPRRPRRHPGQGGRRIVVGPPRTRSRTDPTFRMWWLTHTESYSSASVLMAGPITSAGFGRPQFWGMIVFGYGRCH